MLPLVILTAFALYCTGKAIRASESPRSEFPSETQGEESRICPLNSAEYDIFD